MERRIVLAGFEEAFVAKVGDLFSFSVQRLGKELKLVPGEHLFVSEMPEVDDIGQTATASWTAEDPTLAFICEAVPGVSNSVSSGARLEWMIRVVIRWGVVPIKAQNLLCELYEYLLKNFAGTRCGSHLVKNVISSSRPVGVYYTGDKHAFASMTVRVLGVALLS